MDIIDEFLKIEEAKRRIFKNESVLSVNYIPEKPLFREEELKEIYLEISPIFDGHKATNLFIYGVTGTGKTMVIRYFLEKVVPRLNRDLVYSYVNCREVGTEYRVLVKILRDLDIDFPKLGLSTGDAYRKLWESIDRPILVVLDEVDALVRKSGDGLLYNFSRSDYVSIIGISNDTTFTNMLDARTLSSLMKKDILFKPYNALQLQEILKQRAELAFHEGVLDDDVIPLCAALAAQEHGDARKAIELLYLSGKIAVSEGSDRITADHVKKAVSALEVNNTIELIKSLPLVQKGVLYAIVTHMKARNTTKISLQDVVSAYDKVRSVLNLPSISYKSISRIVSEFETYGILEGRLISLGRGKGVSKVLSLKIPISVLDKISLKELIMTRS